MCMMRSPKVLSQVSAFAIIIIVISVIAIVVFFVIYAVRGEVELVINNKSVTVPFPYIMDTAWPANTNTTYALLELI